MGHYDDFYEFYKDKPCPLLYETGRIDREQYLVHKKIKKKSQTNEEWFDGLSTEEKAEAMANLAFKIATFYNGWRRPDNSLYEKEHWLTWLKQPHSEMAE